MNLDTLIDDLKTHIDRNKLVKADVAKKIGVSPSGLSHLLSRNVNPTGEQALAILNLTKGYKSMSTQIKSEAQLRQEDLDRKLRNVTCKFDHIQHAEFSEGGWVPQEGGNNDPVDTKSIADALETIASSGDNDTIAAKLRALVLALKRVPAVQVEKANVNSGATREPLVIRSADGGARAKVVGTQSFSSDNQNIINVDKTASLLAACKADVAETQRNRIAKSHNLPTAPAVTLKNESFYNCDRTNMEAISNRQNEFEKTVLEDARSLRAVADRTWQIRKEREKRLQSGKGDISDLQVKLNQLRS